MAQDIVGSKMSRTPNLEKGPKGNYGENAYSGPSSTTPGNREESDLARDLRDKANRAGGDGALNCVIGGREAPKSEGPTGQERPISNEPIPAAHGMRNRSNEGPKLGSPARLVKRQS